MDTVVARKRLEEIRDELDRSIAVLEGSGPQRDQPAEYRRLEARPDAARCVSCQGKRDRLRR